MYIALTRSYVSRGADHLFFPAQFEHEITSTMPKCDIIAYPLSPTHAVPHALAMLPAAPEDATEEALMYDGKLKVYILCALKCIIIFISIILS